MLELHLLHLRNQLLLDGHLLLILLRHLDPLLLPQSSEALYLPHNRSSYQLALLIIIRSKFIPAVDSQHIFLLIENTPPLLILLHFNLPRKNPPPFHYYILIQLIMPSLCDHTLLLLASFLLIFSIFEFREQFFVKSHSDPFQIIDNDLMNHQLCTELPSFCHTPHQLTPLYANVLLVFLDAVGYRYVSNKEPANIFQQIHLPNESNLRITKNIPPSTDYTIMALINGKSLASNHLDYFFKTKPNKKEDSLFYQLKRYNLSSSIYSAKVQDWLRMSSDYSDSIFNSLQFNKTNIELADRMTINLYQNRQAKHDFEILHLIGFDALGHALDEQNEQLATLMLEFFNDKVQTILQTQSDDQLVIFLGDHDQSKRGRHYQCSLEFRECDGFIYFSHPVSGFNYHTAVIEPVDVSATISALFGISSPYKSDGKIIPELLTDDIHRIVFAYYVRYHEVFGYDESIKNMSLSCIQKEIHIHDYLQHLDKLFENKKYENNMKQPKFAILIVSLVILAFLIFKLGNLLKKDNILFLVGFLIFDSYFSYFLLLLNTFKERNLIEFIYLAISILLNFKNLIYPTLWPFVYIIIKLLVFQKYYNKLTMRIQIIYLILIISWIISIRQYQTDTFETRQRLVFFQIAIIVIFSFLNPKLFIKQQTEKSKQKLIYTIILFLLQDTCIMIQNHQSNSYIAHTLLLLSVELKFSLIHLQHIYTITKPLLISHSHYPFDIVDSHSFVILSKDFELATMVLQFILGRYGLIIISLLLNDQNRSCLSQVIPYTFWNIIWSFTNLEKNMVNVVLFLGTLFIEIIFLK